MNFLDFEQPIAELEAKIAELRHVSDDCEINITEEVARLQKHSVELTRSIFSNLSAWQTAKIARHPDRPHALDYIQALLDDFQELHGERYVGDDPAIVCGLGRLDTQAVAIIGQQKGRDTKNRIYRNYGMPKPEGYHKALRLMQLAERFRLPLLTLIDTPGAYPGIDAEARGQSGAIASSLLTMAYLKIPSIAIVIGEGGSGGALAIGVADRLMMLEYSTYSVISPEGCASILWKNADKAEQAAEVLGITAQRLHELALIDDIIEEPLGGAHRDYPATMAAVKNSLLSALADLSAMEPAQMVNARLEKIRSYGHFTEV